MKKLRLEILFGGRDKLSPALKIIAGSSNAASKALKKTKDELKALNDQQKKIDGYTKQKKAVQDNAKALQDLQSHIKSLRQQMSTNPSDALTKEFDKAVAKARKLKQEYEKNRVELQRMRTEMNNSGLSTNRLADHQQRLRNQLNQANQALEEQQNRLRRMNQMQQNYQRTSGNLRSAAMYGAGAAATGIGALYAMRKPIDETKRMDITENRIGALGLGKDATKEATQYARAMKTFGTSTLDNMGLMLDGVTAFADVHHAKMVAPTLAKMKFGNEAMFGAEQGAENERLFMDMLKVIELRNGLKSEAAFNKQANIIQQVVTATGGRVQAPEWLNAIKTGGIAVKGLSDEALYYKMEPIVQELGGHRYGTAAMSAYQNIYQGRTTKRAANNMERLGLIADPSKLKHDKAGQISFLDVGAIKGAALFKKDQFAWMEQVLLPELAKKGITERGQIHDAIGSIFTNRTASSLFSTMYDQREQIHKNAKLNAGAENIDQLSDRAKNTTTGKEIEAKAKLHDAYLKFGTTILPVYTKAIEIATDALKGFTGWMEKNPTLAKALGIGLLVIATSLIAIGGALLVFSPLIIGMLSLRLIMASTATGGTALATAFSKVPTVFGFLKTAIFGVGRMFLWLSRALLMNPIGLIITAIAVGAYLIYKNWGSIGPWFLEKWNAIKTGAANAWQEIKTGFSSGILGISSTILNWSPLGLFYRAFAAVLGWFGIELPQKFTGFGGMLIDGLINGIKAGFNKLKSVWSEVTNYIPNVFTKRMDIHSPSRVMAALGGHVMGGIGVGLDQGFPGLKEKFNQVLNVFNPNSHTALEKINVAPALAKINPVQRLSSTNRGDVIVQGDTITIQITAAPGQTIQQLQNMIEGVLNRRDQQKQARVRSSYMDDE
ncbi:phage tail tape measure protein [Acinetobacter johnsonii]|uniref:phage tail tape measure protein n=1 Tax=Acinetobacter johnsonii TaxID=40214 RepID=UPI0010297A56|nr:phage tail tape measure protein [Acinetobacter johnsonii]RZN91886.1 phage tail tape measure protein [Acinetobacter johnsonii]